MAEIVIVPDAATAGALVADEIVRLIRGNPETVLGLATGSTPLPVYEALPARLRGVDVSRVRGFALDEYVGIDPGHPESYRSVITREVVEPLGLDPSLIRTPDGSLDGHRARRRRLRARDRRRPAASTCRSSASAPTATSASTSPDRRSHRSLA